MTPEQVTKVTALISQSAHINPKDFSLYIPLSSYRMDSLDVAGVAVALEEEFDIIIPDSVLETFKTGNDVIEYLSGVV